MHTFEPSQVLRQFRQASFMEAMQALYTNKRIRFAGLPSGYYFKISDSGRVFMYDIRDQVMRPGLAIMCTQEQWEVES